jgi:hypothetical protein
MYIVLLLKLSKSTTNLCPYPWNYQPHLWAPVASSNFYHSPLKIRYE